MTINSVQTYDGNHTYNSSYLPNVVKATAAGAALGYVGKYALFLQKSERKVGEDFFERSSKKFTNEATAYDFEKESTISKAKQKFIDLVEGRDKHRFSLENQEKIIKELGGSKSADGKEFKSIMSGVDDAAKLLKSDFKIGYQFVQRSIRPTKLFMAIGASVGFLSGVFYNVLKTDVKDS